MKGLLLLIFLIQGGEATLRASKSPTTSPTAQPISFLPTPGSYCEQEKGCLIGKCNPPFKWVSGTRLGVCLSPSAGRRRCKEACIHDPEGGSPCPNFPGECLDCRRGRPKKGRCGKKIK